MLILAKGKTYSVPMWHDSLAPLCGITSRLMASHGGLGNEGLSVCVFLLRPHAFRNNIDSFFLKIRGVSGIGVSIISWKSGRDIKYSYG